MADRLTHAPAAIAGELPRNVNDITGTLHDVRVGAAADAYLRGSIDLATRHLFAGMTVIGVVTLVVVLFMPRHFPVLGTAD